MTTRVAGVAAQVREILAEPRDRAEVGELAAALSGLSTEAMAWLVEHRSGPKGTPQEERLLTARAVAALAGVSTRWVYEHADELPFTKRLSADTVRFSERGFREWLARAGVAPGTKR